MFPPPVRSLIPPLLAHIVYTRLHRLGGAPVSLTAAQWRNAAPHHAGLRLALRPLLAMLLPALAALILFAPHVSAEPESAVWSATLTVADQQHSLLGCQSAVPVGGCDDASVLTEDELAYGDVRARVLSLVWDREANAVIVRLDMDWTQIQRDLRLYVDGLVLSLDNAEYLADQLDSDRARWLLSNIGVASLDWSAGDTVRLRLANRPANSAVAPAASTGSTYDPPPPHLSTAVAASLLFVCVSHSAPACLEARRGVSRLRRRSGPGRAGTDRRCGPRARPRRTPAQPSRRLLRRRRGSTAPRRRAGRP